MRGNRKITHESREALDQVLSLLGAIELSKDTEIITYSGADAPGNDKVNQSANDRWMDIARTGELGTCVHVTGEMRALSDRYHRRVCREGYEKQNISVLTIYRLPKDCRDSGDSVLKWNLRNWPKSTWQDHFAACDLIADGSVNVFAAEKDEAVQYSVFGKQYILLQGQHSSERPLKKKWLLQSTVLAGFMIDRAMTIIRGAAPVPSSLFREVPFSLSSPDVLGILVSLDKKRRLSQRQLLASIPSADADSIGIQLARLDMVGFLEHWGEDFALTQSGREYLSLF